VIHLVVIVAGALFGAWLENWIAKRAEERRRIKARLPRRVG
jgi:hypothetical protein